MQTITLVFVKLLQMRNHFIAKLRQITVNIVFEISQNIEQVVMMLRETLASNILREVKIWLNIYSSEEELTDLLKIIKRKLKY